MKGKICKSELRNTIHSYKNFISFQKIYIGAILMQESNFIPSLNFKASASLQGV